MAIVAVRRVADAVTAAGVAAWSDLTLLMLQIY
jgi:hypothetical protein